MATETTAVGVPVTDTSFRGAQTRRASGRAPVSVGAFIAIVVLVLAVAASAALLLTSNGDGAEQVSSLTSAYWLRAGIGADAALAVVVIAIVAALGWWSRVFVDRRPVAGWVGIVPLVMTLQIVATLDYRSVLDTDARFHAYVLVSALIGAFWEEVLFRGIGVEVFRSNGFSEGKVALWTSVLFGLVHVPGMVIDGEEPFMLLVLLLAWITLLGYYYYLARRWSGGLALPVLLHAFWNVARESRLIAGTEDIAGVLLVSTVLLGLVLVIGSTGTHRGLERPWTDIRRRPGPRTPTRRVVLGAASDSHDAHGSG